MDSYIAKKIVLTLLTISICKMGISQEKEFFIHAEEIKKIGMIETLDTDRIPEESKNYIKKQYDRCYIRIFNNKFLYVPKYNIDVDDSLDTYMSMSCVNKFFYIPKNKIDIVDSLDIYILSPLDTIIFYLNEEFIAQDIPLDGEAILIKVYFYQDSLNDSLNLNLFSSKGKLIGRIPLKKTFNYHSIIVNSMIRQPIEKYRINYTVYERRETPPSWPFADTTVVDVIAYEAEFPGGLEAFHKIIKKNIDFDLKNIEGKIFARFVIEKNGKMSNVEILKGVNENIDKKFLHILEAIAQKYTWIPAQALDKTKVRYRKTICIF